MTNSDQDGAAAFSVSVATAFIAASRHRLSESVKTIEHCFGQLAEDDLHWRPFDGHNSPANIILHLCGNVRQWIISGVGGVPDVRQRQQEFDDRTRHSREELLERLLQTVAEADATLASLPESSLLEPRRIQGFDQTPMSAIVDTVAHFVGHTQEIIYITRLRRGDEYVFRWVPKGTEQGG